MTDPNYTSVIKIGGQPILPPIIDDCERPLLRRYREVAMQIEAEIAEKRKRKEEEARKLEEKEKAKKQWEEEVMVQEAEEARKLEEKEKAKKQWEEEVMVQEAEEARKLEEKEKAKKQWEEEVMVQEAEEARKLEEKEMAKKQWEEEVMVQEAEGLHNSSISNMDTMQVMNFIRQALKDSSHLEEVQNLQQEIFDELLKYGDASPQLRRIDSMDTLHNIDDISNAAESSREVSPTKSLHSERSLPKTEKNVNVSSGKSDSLGFENLFIGAEDLIGPRLSLSYPSTPLVETAYVPSVPGPSNGEPKETPPLIRRNSYTLESPSPSVLQYLESLQADEVKTLSPEVTAKRNLNQLWREVLSSTSLDTNSTPVNYSVTSWKSDTEPSSIDNDSVVENNVLDTKSNHSQLDQDKLNCHISPDDMNNSTKKNLCENNNDFSSNIEKAAAKIQAGVRGYLTRRLLKTGRVVELKNAIRDSLITAIQMHKEATVSKAELELHRQLTLQIESLCDEWHRLFFEYTPEERMRIIQVDRMKAKNPKPKKPFLMRKSRSRVSMESSVNSLTSITSSIASRPKSLPLIKPSHDSSVRFKSWK